MKLKLIPNVTALHAKEWDARGRAKADRPNFTSITASFLIMPKHYP